MRAMRSDRPRPAAPLAPVALGLAGGAGMAFALEATSLGLCLAPVLILAGTAYGRGRVMCWSALLGLLLAHGQQARSAPPGWFVRSLPCLCALEGTVRHVEASPPSRERLVLDTTWVGEGPARRRLDHPIRLTLWTRRGPGLPITVRPGAVLRCVARVERTGRGGGSTPGLEGRLPDARAVTVLRENPAREPLLLQLRRRAADRFQARLADRDAALARALLLGDRSRLAPADRDAFRRAGQAHLLAVSGIHVGLLLAGVVFLLRRLGCPLRATWLTGLVVAALYVPFTGAPASAVRAGLGAALYFFGRLLGRPPGGAAVLALVATAVLLVHPGALLNISFRLSFAAVIGIFALAPRLHDVLAPPRPVVPGVLPPRRTPVRSALAVALAAWLGTAPLVALHIGRLCPAGAPISIAALPLAATIIASGFVLLLLGAVAPIAHAASGCFAFAAQALRGILDLASAAGLGTVPMAAPGWGDSLIYALGFLWAARGRPRGRALALGLAVMGGVLLRLGLTADGAPRSAGAGEYHQIAVAISPLIAALEADTVAWLGAGLLVFAVLAVRPLGWLSPAGATGAWVLGVASGWSFGWAGVAALFAPFTVGTLLGRLPGPARSGPRTLRQVVSNGLPALLGCVAAALGEQALGLGLFLGGLACLGADTCATEIGTRYGGRTFRLVGRGPIARGESGGVTTLGLLTSVGAAFLAPAAYAIVAGAPSGLPGAAAAAGVVGALLDSVLGGTVQYRGRHPNTGEVVERRQVNGRPTERHSGLAWLDNDGVNLATGLCAGLLAVALLGLV